MKKDIPRYPVPHVVSIQDMILQSAKSFADKLAIEDCAATPIPRLTYSGLLNSIVRFGAALQKLEIPERSHIAVIGENRVQWAVTYLTAMCFNYVIVPIDKNLSTNEILNVVHESDVSAIVYSDQFEEMLREKRATLKKLRHYIGMDKPKASGFALSMTELIGASAVVPLSMLPKITPSEMAVIIFTSGTLGRAKGVMLSQRNIASNLMSMLTAMQMLPEDRFLSVLPMHHTYECNCGMLCPLMAGSSVHYARSLKTVTDDMQSVHATILLGVPLLYEKMFKRIYKGVHEHKSKALVVPPLIQVSNVLEKVGWKNCKKVVFKELHEKFGGSIRVFIAGGAASDPTVARGLRDFGFTYVQGYGLTETSPILALNPLAWAKDDAAGLPLPGVELMIHEPDEEGIGEVYAKGENVMLGYYKNPDATRETFDDGWFKTGDYGYLDDDGFLHISGRKKNVIISKSGKNVFPEEVEDALNHSAFILESLVFGEHDPKQGEIIAAKIVVDAEAFIELSARKGTAITPELIHSVINEEVQRINKELTSFKQVKKFYIHDQEFQKTTTQKIKRFAAFSE
ncbi:MAG TPA: AMP-binding protein [Bacteroidota bacterium]|nr:AMP-binding protein [Bacteroidota bacterium]